MTRAPKQLRIAVAGAGAIGRRHIELIGESPECKLSAIVDPSPATAELAARAGVPLFASLADLLAADRPDGVIDATPNSLHVANALLCIDAGIAVLVEKPIAHTVDEGERLVRAVETTPEARVLIGHHRAHSPILARSREIIRSGALGPLVAITASAMFHKPDSYYSEGAWRRRIGGGPILINLIHEIGNLRSLCGDIVAVQASKSNATRGFEVEDTAAILLRFANGALGTFMLSDTAAAARSWEQTSQENKDYASYDDEDCYVIAGTKGSLSIPTMRLKTFGPTQTRSWFEPYETAVAPVDRRDPLALQLAHFCAVVRGEASPLVTANDGLQNLRIVEAVAQAARSGEVVDTAEANQSMA